MKNNDTTILELKQQLEEKKSKIKSVKRTVYKTNCSLTLFKQVYNLHTLSISDLALFLSMLTSWKREAESLNIIDNCIISGYNVNEWISDIQSKYDEKSMMAELESLSAIEKRLGSMLSTDKKIELELENIAQLLK